MKKNSVVPSEDISLQKGAVDLISVLDVSILGNVKYLVALRSSVNVKIVREISIGHLPWHCHRHLVNKGISFCPDQFSRISSPPLE